MISISAELRYFTNYYLFDFGVLSFSAAYPLKERLHLFSSLDLFAGRYMFQGDFPVIFLSARAGVKYVMAGNKKVQFLGEFSLGGGQITLQPQLTRAVTLPTFVTDAGLLFRFRIAAPLMLETGFGKHSIKPMKHGYFDVGSIYARAGIVFNMPVKRKSGR